ncbi:MAG: hypothetical protein LBM02_04220 [Lachnospiraceae bacterium]|jgi:SNF2 family DNA or RNA helicase|nr:hypothetical protein [Lachnospiraceae bacterium]
MRYRELNGVIADSVSKLIAMQRMYANNKDKLDYLHDVILDTERNVIIFYQYDLHCDLLKKLCKEMKKEIFVINGKEKHFPEKDYNGKNSVTMVQVQAGGSGIELTYAPIAIFFSPTYSYQDYVQCLGRNNRIGSKVQSEVYLFRTKGLEEYIYSCLENKQDFAEKKYIENSKEYEGLPY